MAGFESDWRDTYPGINAVTLMEMLAKPDSRQGDLLPVVRYSALQRIRSNGDYWDHATLMEAAVLSRAEEEALDMAAATCARATKPWELATTLGNLADICAARQSRGETLEWLDDIIRSLQKKKSMLEAS